MRGISDQQRVIVKVLYVIAALGAVLVGVTLWAWGQPLTCACGEVKLWVGLIWSGHNSQHLADWYSLSHVIHGMLIVLMGRLLFPRMGYPALLLIAIVTGVAWEIVEHTDWVLGRFRSVTLYQGYLGDTVLNAVADYAWMWVGFFLAASLPTVWIAVAILALELVATVFARDSLTLTTLMLVYPVEAIETWQQAINPLSPPDG